MKWLNLFLAIYLLSSETDGGVPPGEWTHQVNLVADSGVKFRWKNVNNNTDKQNWLVMEFSARASGYIGVGFSPHGGMDGGDMVIVWEDSDGTPRILVGS